MKFNAPPNWPRPPAGWSPPPDWEPDPSWPQPPPGWPLWVAEDEFIISPHRAAASRAQTTEPWHRRTVTIVLLLIFFFPVGLILLWMRPDWSVMRRGIVTAIVGIVVIIALANPNPPPTNTTATTTTTTSPAAVAGATSSSPAPASSQAAAPTTAVTTPAPVTSAAPQTTAAAAVPVYTSAAAVRTTQQTSKAPQPVQTTAQASCYPLTNGGNCYKPGEFCRTSDHGVTGIDANGDAIKCEDNDGWRWEPV